MNSNVLPASALAVVVWSFLGAVAVGVQRNMGFTPNFWYGLMWDYSAYAGLALALLGAILYAAKSITVTTFAMIAIAGLGLAIGAWVGDTVFSIVAGVKKLFNIGG